ncbi:MAG: hypothetical protein COA77_00315 [Thaumarchaeota archaeon]|nr:MAG: hypothetical protein COA77_00315 [Nitrososphaerota archaeon]
MKINVKLITSFLGIVLIGGLTGYVAFTGINDVFIIFDIIADETTPELLLLGEIESLSHVLQLNAINYVLLVQSSATSQRSQEEIEEFNKTNLKLVGTIIELKKLEEEEGEKAEGLEEKDIKELEEEFLQQIIGLKAKLQFASLTLIGEINGETDSPKILAMIDEIEIAQEELNEVIETRIEQEKQELERRNTLADEITSNASDFIVIVSLVGVIFVACLGIFVSKTISKPISKLQNATNEILNGNLSISLDIKGSDEMSSLSNSFNKMTTFISKSQDKIQCQLLELTLLDKQKDDFLSMLSHELRTPLVPINGICEILLDKDSEISQEQRELIQSINSNSSRLGVLIDKLLLIQKLELGKYNYDVKNINVKEIMHEIYSDNFTIMSKRQIEFTNSTKDDNVIYGDKNSIHLIFSNLINNSLDFLPKENPRIEIGTESLVGKTVFFVKDNGSGIATEHQEKIFKKFYQSDLSFTRKHGGFGIGLAICKKLVTEMSGTMWVESQEGKGASFYFTIKNGDKN